MRIYPAVLKLIPFYFGIRTKLLFHKFELKIDFLRAGFQYLIIFVA